MLTGCLPRDFPKNRDPWLVVLEDAAIPILKRGVNLPLSLAELIDKALDENSEPAFARAAVFRHALEEWG